MSLATILLTLTLAAIAVATLISYRFLALLGRHRVLESHAAELERELAALNRRSAQVEADQQFLVRFIRELPHVAHELHAGSGGRQIPRLLLGAVSRLFDPRKSVVLVRRRPAESDPGRHRLLAVAAAAPAECMEQGSEIPIGRGEIGYAAEVLRVMDRRDFDNQPPAVRLRLREETGAGFQPDVVAPMIFGEQVVGALAFEGTKGGAATKDALRLLAQVGAVSVHTQARYTEMKATAAIDGLTGIFNKRYLTHRLADEIRRALDEVTPLSLFIFDIDNFKHFNDRNGHLAGDRLLRSLARLVQENVRKDSIFGRYGGEEFLILFPRTGRAKALAAAENVRRVIAAHEFPFGLDQPLGFVSISGGVAECPVDARDAAGLVRAADEALYEAKRSERNRVLPYEPRYLGEEAQEPVPVEDLRANAALHQGTRIAADYTPEPGTLMSLASITPAAGVPRLTLEPSAERLAAALPAPAEGGAPPEAASPSADTALEVVEDGSDPVTDEGRDD